MNGLDPAWYPALKHAHVALVSASGLFFAARGVAVLRGRTWPQQTAVRRASALLDTLLLAAGVSLWLMLGLDPLRDTWLGAKLLCIVAYIAAGIWALRRARTPRGRAVAFTLALALLLWIVGIARFHAPLGPLSALVA